MRGDAITYEGYFDGATAETLHDPRSVGKSITALAVGIAIERKHLPGVSAPAFSYLADLRPFAHAGPQKDAITIDDLLTMSSALDCDDNTESSPGNEELMYPKRAWARWAVDLPIAAGWRRDDTGRGPFRYCTAGSFLLGQIVQRAAKVPIDAFIAEHLFAPLGIERWQFGKSPSGEVMTGGSLRLTTRALAALGWLVRSDGAWRGRQVVPAAWIRASLTAHRPAFGGESYGYQFWHRTYRHRCGETPAWRMSGNGGNSVVIFADLDAVVVVTRTRYATRGMHEETHALIERQILPALACR